MVRRWSHLNKIQTLIASERSLEFKSFNYVRKLAKAYVFRTFLLSRRFNRRYLTKFKRKAYTRLRHKSNWAIYHSIFKFWSLDFLNNKYPAKFEFMLNLFVDNFFFFNFNFVKNKSFEGFSNWNFCYANKILSKKPLFRSPWEPYKKYASQTQIGCVSWGWSHLYWQNYDKFLSNKNKTVTQELQNDQNFKNFEELYVSNLAIPMYSFWDDSLFPSVHSFSNYAKSYTFSENYESSIKKPDFSMYNLNDLIQEVFYNNIFTLHTILILLVFKNNQ